MFVLVAAVLSGLTLRGGTVASAASWYVGNSDEACRTVTVGYDNCFNNFDDAVAELARRQVAANASNLDVVLAPGQHTLQSTHTIDCAGYNAVNIRSQQASQLTVINGTTDIDDFDVIPKNRLLFLSCVNVSISDVTVDLSSPGIFFHFTFCRHVNVRGCTFINTLGISGSLYFTNTLPVDISNSTFQFTIPFLGPRSKLLVPIRNNSGTKLVYFAFGDGGGDRGGECAYSMRACQAMDVTNSTFEPVSIANSNTFYGYGNLVRDHNRPFQRESLLKVTLRGENTRLLSVSITNCHFRQMVFGYSAPVVFYVADKAANNIITLSHSTLRDNKCTSGCGLLVLFQDNPINNTISVTDTQFINNTAVVEGGALFALYENLAENSSSRNRLDIQRCHFQNNSATHYFGAGSAVMIYSNKEPTAGNSERTDPLPAAVNFTDCHFLGNEAIYGTVFIKNSDVQYHGHCVFVGNTGGAIYAFGSNVTMTGRHNISHNTGALNGGGLSLQFWSRATFTNVEQIVFAHNKASVSGGAIYADSTSSSQTYVDLLNSLSGIGIRKRCFITLDDDVQIDYEGTTPRAKIHFWENSASVSGNDMYASTYLLCGVQLLAPIHLLRHDYPLAANPILMAFVSASCRCAKTVGSQTLYFENGECNRQTVADAVLSNTSDGEALQRMEESFRCWDRTTTTIFNRAYPRGRLLIGTKFLYNQLWVPFSNCLLSGSSSLINLTTGLSLAEVSSLICPGILTASRIKLTPSPGERFNLTVEALDEFLQNVSTLASLTVYDHSDVTLGRKTPSALLHHAGTEYGANAQLYFDPLQPINDLSLAGPVGAKGHLRVLWQSYLHGFSCSLYIPFELSACYYGFDAPYADTHPKWTKRYIQQSHRVTRPISNNSSRLTCTCSKKDGVRCDSDGRTMTVKNNYWAGKIGQHTGEFVTHPCLGQCSSHGDADEAGYWAFNSQEPNKHCLQSRSGVLCRSCQESYAETPSGMACQQCQSGWQLGLSMFILFVAVLGAVLVVISMLTGLLGTQYFDAWIFYIQIAPLVLRPGEEVTVLHSVSSYTVSLIHLNVPWCVSSNLSQLSRLVTVAMPPLYLFFLVFLLFMASYVRPFSRHIERPKVGETFLVVLIVAYEPLAVFATSTLSCSVLFGDDIRLYADPNVVCFDTTHLPYAIAAICLLLVIIPLPALLIYGARDSHANADSSKVTWIKRLSQACARSYGKETQWWVGVTLWRRFLIAALAATITTDLTTRQIVLFSVCLALLLFNAIVLPYRSDTANKYELVLLANLALISAFSINDLSTVSLPKQIAFSYILLAVLAWPDISIIMIAVYNNRQQFRRLISWVTRRQSNNETDMLMLRARARLDTATTSFSSSTEEDIDMQASSDIKDPWIRSSSEIRDPLLIASTRDKALLKDQQSAEQ